MNEGLCRMGDTGTHQVDESGRIVLYPQPVVNTDAKIDQTQNRIHQARIRLKDLQLKHTQSIQIPRSLPSTDKFQTDLWSKEDEIDIKSIEHRKQCCLYYEDKLHHQQLLHLDARNNLMQHLSTQDTEIGILKERIEYLQKQAQNAVNKMRKLESEAEHVENYRKNQKERIIDLLIQEKQDIFNKYNVIQKEDMALLQFTHLIEDILHKKNYNDREEDTTKIPCIKEIQLEATKLYASLTNPIIQQILNAFTQVVNALHKKNEKPENRDDRKTNKNEKYNKGSNRIALSRPKSSQSRDSSSLHLKQEEIKVREDYEKKLEEAVNLYNSEKDKCTSLRKKVEKYEGQLQNRSKEIELYQQKQVDSDKKIEWLGQSLLDYERKLKMQNEQLTNLEECRFSSPEMTNQNDFADLRQNRKSPHKQNYQHPHHSKLQVAELHSQISKKSEQIEQLKTKIKNINRILIDKEESLLKSEKKVEDCEAKLKQKKEIISTKQHEVQQLKFQIVHKDQKIQKILFDLTNEKNQSDRILGRVAILESEINSKNMEIQEIQLSFSQIYKHLQNSLTKFNAKNPISATAQQQEGKKSKMDQIRQLIENVEHFYEKQLKSAQDSLLSIKGEAGFKQAEMKKIVEELKVQLSLERNKGAEARQTISKMVEQTAKQQHELEEVKIKLNQSLQQQMNLFSLNQTQDKKVEDLQHLVLNKQEQSKELRLAKTHYANQITELQLKIEEITRKIEVSEATNTNLQNQLGKLNLLLKQKDEAINLQHKKCQGLKQEFKSQLIQYQKKAQHAEKAMVQKLEQRDYELKKAKEQKSEMQRKLQIANQEKEQKNELLRQKQQQFRVLLGNLEQMQEKASDIKVSGLESSLENEDNLNQSNQLSLMQAEIFNFKQQLNDLLNVIQGKDKQIQTLVAKLNQETEKNKGKILKSAEKSTEFVANLPQNMSAVDEIKRKMIETITEQQQQIERLRTQQIKHEILSKKLEVLQGTLERQKEIYQNEIIKNSKRIFDLEDEIRYLKQEVSAKKRKVFSEEYFSLDPQSNKLSSKGKTSGNGQPCKIKTFKVGKPQSREQMSSEVFHSLEEDFIEEALNRKKQEEELDSEKITRCRLRRQKSQGYDRKISNERYFDSDEKLRQEKELKVAQIDGKSPVELSPAGNSLHELKNVGAIQKQKEGMKPNPTNLVSNEEIPLMTNSDNSSLNEIIKNLSQENKQLKSSNEVLKKDFRQITQFMQIFDKTWKSEKALDNCSESGKLINTQKLLQNLKLLEHSKIKLLEQFNSSDLQTMFDNISKLIYETKRWVDLIERLTSLNNKLSLEVTLLKRCPKFVKTRTLRVGENESHHQRSRSVYSEGNVYKQHHIDVDESPFEMHDDHHQQLPPQQNPNLPAPANSLQILFKENVEMSEISSVKHKSHNSGFLNSKSEIAKMFEKGEKHEKDGKDLKKEDIKKDIVDQYLTLNQRAEKGQKFEKGKNINTHLYQSASNNKIYQSRVHNNLLQNSPLMQKNSSNYYQETSNMQSLYNQKYEMKSNKAKRKAISKTVTKLATINSKINEHKKEYTAIIKNIIQKYEDKIAHLQVDFSNTVKKIMQNSVPIELFRQLQKKDKQNSENIKLPVKPSIETPSTNRPVISNRISEKDEQIQEKIQQLQTKIQRQKKQVESRDKSIGELKEQLKQAEKKIKQQKAIQQSLKSKYTNEVSHSTHLSSRIEKISLDFKNFIQKIIINQRRQKRKYKEIGIQAQIQVQQFFSPTNLENQKRFLKSKKILPKPESTNSVENIKEGGTSLVKSEEFKTEKKNEKSLITEKNLIQQNSVLEEKKNQKVEMITEESKEKKLQKLPKQETKQEIELTFGRIKSEPSDGKKKQQQQRQSDKSEGEFGKPLTFGAIFSNIMNANSNSLTKKKTISEASKPDQVFYYQTNLGEINKQIQELLAQYFKQAKIESQKLVELQDEIFKSKRERDTKIKTELENEKEREREKQGQKKLKDEEEIRLNIKVLETEIVKYKKQASKSAEEREDRLKLIIKKIVETFKISKKSVDRVINQIEKKQANSAKYIDARLFFKNVYNEIKVKDQQNKQDKQINLRINKASSLDNEVANDLQVDAANEFDSYEQRYRALQKLNEKLKADLFAKNQQFLLFKHDQLGYGEGKKANSRQHSFVSNENSEQFEDFEHRELFDNTKPTFELVEEMKIELEYYKKKYEEQELAANRKKTEKVKYIRKW